MDIGHLMSRGVITIRPTATIDEAVRLMLDHSVSGLPVTDEAGKLVGIVTEGDFLRRSELHTERARPPRWVEVLIGPGREAIDYIRAHARKVSEVMTTDLQTLTPEASLQDAVSLMERAGVKRIPVVRRQKLIGIITRSDLLKALLPKIATKDETLSDDNTIMAHLRRELRKQGWSPKIGVNFSAENGVVTASGVVFDDTNRKALLLLAQNVPGVQSVHDDIIVLA